MILQRIRKLKLTLRNQLILSITSLLTFLIVALGIQYQRMNSLSRDLFQSSVWLQSLAARHHFHQQYHQFIADTASAKVARSELNSRAALLYQSLQSMPQDSRFEGLSSEMQQSLAGFQTRVESSARRTDDLESTIREMAAFEKRWMDLQSNLSTNAEATMSSTGKSMIEAQNTTFLLLSVVSCMGFLLCVALVKNLRFHTGTFRSATGQLAHGISRLEANLELQQSSASQQAASVEETKRTLETLLSTAHHIAESSRNVLKNAEVSQMTNQRISQRIKELSKSTERIGEILELIKEVANKSDILSLNAALEGTKAGEAGKGFSLVASQMQRLASQVMGSVNNIKTLTAEIMEATNSSVLATEEAYKMAEATTRSARQISLSVRQQQSGTEQVTKAMDRIATVAKGNVDNAGTMVLVSKDLTAVNTELNRIVDRF